MQLAYYTLVREASVRFQLMSHALCPKSSVAIWASSHARGHAEALICAHAEALVAHSQACLLAHADI